MVEGPPSARFEGPWKWWLPTSDIARLLGKVRCADAAEFVGRLPDESIDFVMTSPPYWGLRDYGAEGQIGLEKHPQEYIKKLAAIFHDLKRVLKSHGSFYLNLGDTYCNTKGSCFNAGGGPNSIAQAAYKHLTGYVNPNRMLKPNNRWLQPKQLLMIPARAAVALQEDGWILRNDIIWYKPNGLPSSVKDRLANKYEHVFHFVKSRRYYYDLDSIRVPQETLRLAAGMGRLRNHQVYNPYDSEKGVALGLKSPGGMVEAARAQRRKGALRLLRSDGKNPGDVAEAGHKTTGLGKICSMRNPPEPDEPDAFHPLGKNPGDVHADNKDDLDLWKGIVLDEYAKIGKTGQKRFSGKHELLDEGSGSFRALLNSGQARNSVYSIIESLDVSAGLKQRLRTWWHDHSSHFHGPNPGDFWQISTRPFPEAHFAVYPEELCVRPILSSCPRLVCKGCGKAPVPIMQKQVTGYREGWRAIAEAKGMPVEKVAAHLAGGHTGLNTSSRERRVVGWKKCGCSAPFEPGIVFDPFAGAGTTLLVAEKLGRQWFGCDLNPKFVRMAHRRLSKS